MNRHDFDLRVELRHPAAKLPERKTEGAAAFDLSACEEAYIPPGHRWRVNTGVALAIPDGWCGIVKSRSGLAAEGFTVDFGLIDPDYRGEVGIQCVNANRDYQWHVKPGDRIAQLLLLPVALCGVAQVGELPPTARGDRGFGSTGR